LRHTCLSWFKEYAQRFSTVAILPHSHLPEDVSHIRVL
jgi:hypothetical protein